jgi:antirestriction protein ArdC
MVNLGRNDMTKTRDEIQAEALQNATQSQSLMNYPAIFQGFMAKGINEADIKPRENIFTFNAWKALGRSVRKGEHGVKVITWISVDGKVAVDSAGNETTTEGYRKPHTTTVFHVSQTELTSEREKRGRFDSQASWRKQRNGHVDPYVDIDRMYEDQCSDICGR